MRMKIFKILGPKRFLKLENATIKKFLDCYGHVFA